MVDLADKFYGWPFFVYKLGCAFIHLSAMVYYKNSNPFLLLSVSERNDITRFLHQYHSFPLELELNLENIITKNYSDLEYIYNDVNQFYLEHFFTLKGKISFSEKQEKEDLFISNFPNHTVGEESDIIWLKFKFSEAIVPDILQNVRFALNCVPMLNIKNKHPP